MDNLKIVCHDNEYFAQRFAPHKWEVREPNGTYGANLRHCSYCGSIHPLDLLKVLGEGAQLQGADWKYGWPHKFYVAGIKNPMAGQTVKVGGRHYTNDAGEPVDEDIMGKAPETLTVKFYNEHLIDLFGTPEFEQVTEAIRQRTGVQFENKDGKLYYITCQWGNKNAQ